MVCPRLLELDKRHGEHRAGPKYPLHPDHFGRPMVEIRYGPEPDEVYRVPGAPPHGEECGCLIDPEGHLTATVIIPPGEEIAEDHPDLTCKCGELLVVGEWIS